MNDRILVDCRQLSSGTIATLTGFSLYTDIDKARDYFVYFVECSDTPYETWQDAWFDYLKRREGCPVQAAKDGKVVHNVIDLTPS